LEYMAEILHARV